ncbi:MAG: hypothetical protein AABW80_03355 [Nanoarchaeota archaeon]
MAKVSILNIFYLLALIFVFLIFVAYPTFYLLFPDSVITEFLIFIFESGNFNYPIENFSAVFLLGGYGGVLAILFFSSYFTSNRSNAEKYIVGIYLIIAIVALVLNFLNLNYSVSTPLQNLANFVSLEDSHWLLDIFVLLPVWFAYIRIVSFTFRSFHPVSAYS